MMASHLKAKEREVTPDHINTIQHPGQAAFTAACPFKARFVRAFTFPELYKAILFVDLYVLFGYNAIGCLFGILPVKDKRTGEPGCSPKTSVRFYFK